MTHVDSGQQNEHLEEGGLLPEGAVEQKVMSRRMAIRFGLRTALGLTALAAVGTSMYRKRLIDKPRQAWKHIETIGDKAADLYSFDRRYTSEILRFDDELREAGLSQVDVVGHAEYERTIEGIADSIIRAAKEDRDSVSLEQHVRKYAMLTGNVRLSNACRARLKADMADVVRASLPLLENEMTRDPQILHLYHRFAKILHYADLTIDDVVSDPDRVRAKAMHFMEGKIADANRDASSVFLGVEVASLLEERMGMKLKPLLEAEEWKKLGIKELREITWWTAIGGHRPSPDGYNAERLLAINRVASFAGIGRDDPEYVAALAKVRDQMKRSDAPGVLLRRLERGESY